MAADPNKPYTTVTGPHSQKTTKLFWDKAPAGSRICKAHTLSLQNID